MNGNELYHHNVHMLAGLSPPIEAFGIGGSAGSGKTDSLSDLDFFIFVPSHEFRQFLEDFPTMITHPKTPIARRARGFIAFFGFQFTFLYDDCSSVDYFVNCAFTLFATPMAYKTRVLHDLTGYFTAFHTNLPGRTELQRLHLQEATAELLSEAIRIKKYAKRNDLIAIVHRLERIRLVVLALERYLYHQQYFIPHDADKWVSRDLGIEMIERLRPSFPVLSPLEIAESYRSVWTLAVKLMRKLDSEHHTTGEVWALFDDLGKEIHASLLSSC